MSRRIQSDTHAAAFPHNPAVIAGKRFVKQAAEEKHRRRWGAVPVAKNAKTHSVWGRENLMTVLRLLTGLNFLRWLSIRRSRNNSVQNGEYKAICCVTICDVHGGCDTLVFL